eukprot:1501391-Pleurochrysis_carterae.AAC.3
MTSAQRRPPSAEGRKGPHTSTCMSRPECEGLYDSVECGRRVAFASAHASQEGTAAWRRLCGASKVSSESLLRRAPPQCRRRCM